MTLRRLGIALAFALAIPSHFDVRPSQAAPVVGPTDAPFWTGMADAPSFARAMEARLAHARQRLAGLLAVDGARTIANTLRPHDDMLLELDAAVSQAGLIQVVHPDAAVRGVAEEISRKASALAADVALDPRVYEALAALDGASADAETRYYLERTLRDFRLAGVDRDDQTRQRIKALRGDLVRIGQAFDRNIRHDVRRVTVHSAVDLDGLPADYIARHTPGPSGAIALTTSFPDALPVFMFARSEDLRRRMYVEYNNRAYPTNTEVLDRMLARRADLARLVGYRSWSDYATADKMVGTAKGVTDFIDQVVLASGPKARREYETLLHRRRRDVPGATGLNAWDRAYYAELVRQARYGVDARALRPYFAYAAVKHGILDVVGQLFGLSFQRVSVAVWDPSVEVYEMWTDGRLVGRVYLDMHPRADKFMHAARFVIRTGVANRQVPEVALVCNVPGGQVGDPGLLTHHEVVTLFHEFGHVLQSLFAGHRQWIGTGGNNLGQDFVEVPSKLLEEWAWDPAVLTRFAQHYQTSEPIADSLLRRMRRASEFGKALAVRQQMVNAKFSLSIYDRDPRALDTTRLLGEITNAYLPFPHVEGTHFQTAFGHLDDYAGVYYAYMWSEVIAKDLFGRFARGNLLARDVARRYVDTILAPGSSKPPETLLRDFLGRPFDLRAWETWLNQVEEAPPT
jgi:Zn-dependent oligopeptidase